MHAAVRRRYTDATVVHEQFGGLADARQHLALIAPCYGDHGSRARFADTLACEVAFAEPTVRDYLTVEELDILLKLHPAGAARFWGATSR